MPIPVAASSRRGQVLPLVAVSIALFLALAAVAIDLGMLYGVKAEAQRTADAAALAGAGQYLLYPDGASAVGAVDSAAREFAKRNQILHAPVTDADIASVVPNPAELNVAVTIERANVPNWFANALGFPASTVRAFAVARVSNAGTVQCPKPVAIEDLWSEPGPPAGADTLSPDGVDNRVWDIPGPPPSGNYPDTPPIELWQYTGAQGQTYDAATTGYGTGFRNGRSGVYQGPKVNDYGRRLVLVIEDPPVSHGIAAPSFYWAWGTHRGGGNDPGGTSANSVGAGITAQCGIPTASVGTSYPAAHGIGAGQIGTAWEDLYAQDPGASWDEATNAVVGSNACPATGTCGPEDWMKSPRVVTVGLVDPTALGSHPDDLVFTNFARVFVERPFSVGGGGSPKRWVTGIFLGYVQGLGSAPGQQTGSLVKVIQLVR